VLLFGLGPEAGLRPSLIVPRHGALLLASVLLAPDQERGGAGFLPVSCFLIAVPAEGLLVLVRDVGLLTAGLVVGL
jgi:hypothetical protein